MLDLSDNSTEGRKQALIRFVSSWYGLSLERHPAGSECPSLGCPDLLAWWTAAFSRHPELKGVHYSFVPPELWPNDEPFSIPSRVESSPLWVFYVENQGIATWASENGPDPAVWIRTDTGTERDAEPLSGVLLQSVLFEAVFGAPCSGETHLQRAEFLAFSELTRVPLKPTTFGGHEFYVGDNLLVCTSAGDSPDELRLFIGAKTPDSLKFLSDVIDNPWDFDL